MKEPLQQTRRLALVKLATAGAALISGAPSLLSQMMPNPVQPLSSPNAPKNTNAPAGLDGADLVRQPGQSSLSPMAWSAIKSEADKLLQMATDFKQKIDTTNLAATLPLPLLKEAHMIEKMAKDIQSRMRS